MDEIESVAVVGAGGRLKAAKRRKVGEKRRKNTINNGVGGGWQVAGRILSCFTIIEIASIVHRGVSTYSTF